MLILAKTASNTPKLDVNLPTSLRHRSVAGDTLFIVPGATYELTPDEWEFIKTKHSQVIPYFQLLGQQRKR